MPVHDWQFWLVTLVALWRLTALTRSFLGFPRPATAQDTACSRCALGQAACRSKSLAS